MDMPPHFERLYYGLEQPPRPPGRAAAACVLILAVCAGLVGLKIALGPGFVLLDAAGALFGP